MSRTTCMSPRRRVAPGALFYVYRVWTRCPCNGSFILAVRACKRVCQCVPAGRRLACQVLLAYDATERV